MKSFRDFLRETSALLTGQMPHPLQSIIDEELAISQEAVGVTDRTSIPATTQIPIENPTAWLKIADVIACFVDMEGSTRLSATSHPNSTAKAYRLFTNTAIRVFHEFEAPYIDVKGDGVFALFDRHLPHTALAAVVTFKTIVSRDISPRIKALTKVDVGGHFGIDQRTVLVRKIGLKSYDGRSDRQNEVWAGKPINMAAKLASLSTGGQLLVSDRYFTNLKGDKALNSCGCPNGDRKPLWSKIDVSDDDRFDFGSAFQLTSDWCKTHGLEYCKAIAKYDEGLEVK
jgi:class 3 adenylate cyclase